MQFKLTEYIEELHERNIKPERIEGFISSLKENKISNLIYLPEYKVYEEVILEESFAQLDLTASHKLDYLHNEDLFSKSYKDGDRIFSLSNYGFYIFLFKLSIHLCRIREGVFRG